MNQSFLPWWLVLLLGLWAVALAVWQHPAISRESRLWAGFSILIYLAFLFLAIGFGPSNGPVDSTTQSIAQISFIATLVCIAVGLSFGVMLLGSISANQQRLCYVLFAVAGSGFCALNRALEIAIGLLIIAAISAKPFVVQHGKRVAQSLRDLFLSLLQFEARTKSNEMIQELVLNASLNFVLGCVLIGTLAFSLRMESKPDTANPLNSALPSTILLHQLQGSDDDSPSLMSSAFGNRAEVLILLAVIVFLWLAISLDRLREEKGPIDTSAASAADSSSDGSLPSLHQQEE